MATIVCAVDGSPGSRDALRVATELSETLGLRLVLAHVARRIRPAGGLSLGNDAQARDRAEILLERACREHGLDGLVERRVEVGDCATELARIVSEEGASMLVVGSRHSRTLRRGLAGDLATELGCTLGCPVVVVPPTAGARGLLRAGRGAG
jgi:nucleotide-binding universal stress UspA family protein